MTLLRKNTQNRLTATLSALLILILQFISFSGYCQGPPYAQGAAPNCMKTNNLVLNTGWNWQTNTNFWQNQQENYWRIISADGTPVPVCATTWASWMPSGWTLYPIHLLSAM